MGASEMNVHVPLHVFGFVAPLFLCQHKISGFQGYTACLLIMAVRSLYPSQKKHFPPLFKCPGSHDFGNWETSHAMSMKEPITNP